MPEILISEINFNLRPEPIEGSIALDDEKGEETRARLSVLETENITDDEKSDIHDQALHFLKGLSDKTFASRFVGIARPTTDEGYDSIINKFLYGDRRALQLITIKREDNDELIGVCSIFRHDLRNPDGENDSEHVVELSFTVADRYQRHRLGTTLLATAAEVAADNGKSYVYASFAPGNQRSRDRFEKMFGMTNIVAGITNPTDKYFRIIPTSQTEYPSDFEHLERLMRIACGEDVPAVEDVPTAEPKRKARMGRYVLSWLEQLGKRSSE